MKSPRNRRSGCIPAEPYPPLRPLVVYPQQQIYVNEREKKELDSGSAFRHANYLALVGCFSPCGHREGTRISTTSSPSGTATAILQSAIRKRSSARPRSTPAPRRRRNTARSTF